MPARPSDAPARVLADRFELREVLGHGGMATVWSALDLRLDRIVAVKLLRPDLPADQGMRIEREARAAARITDPRVVTVLDFDHTPDGTPFLVMQAHGGHTLADDLGRGRLPRARVERLAADIVGALAAAHAEGVLHRDLKPSNILSDPDGYRLTDFGIASVDDDLETDGDLLGTLAYVAPERFDGRSATARSDVFSLGVVLYEAITGRQPFRGDSAGDTLHRLRHGIAAALPPDTPPALARVVSASLRLDPLERPEDGRAMQAELTVDLHAPTEPIEAGDSTQRLDPTAVLRSGPSRSAMRPPEGAGSEVPPTPDLGALVGSAADAVRPAMRRTAGAARSASRRLHALADDNPPAAIALAATVLFVLVLLLTLVTPDRDARGESDPAPAPAETPAAQLDADLDRIEELGR